MANVRAFKALSSNPAWFNKLLEHADEGLSALKHALEARGASGIGTGSVNVVEAELLKLIEDEHFLPQNQDAIYVYEQESITGKQYGIWLQTAVQDFLDGVIVKHEQTLEDREKRIAKYRASVGLEGSPVLLMYRPQAHINEFIEEVKQRTQVLNYQEEGKLHRIWKVDHPAEIEELTALFKTINKVYVGDGHHRLAAAASMQKDSPQWVMALYVSTVQLRIASFNRLIVPDQKIDKSVFLDLLQKMFFISAVPGNVAYQPDRLHRLGLFLDGEWFQLDLKPKLYPLLQLPDVVILQDKIFAPFFGISDPKSDPKLFCYPSSSFDEMMNIASHNPNSIVFSIYTMSVHKLIEQAEKGIALPPKSSFIEPKIPYGLLLNAQSVFEKAELREKIC